MNANGYIDSQYIAVFPTVRRIGKASESRNLSEKAITRIVNSLIDKSDGFVITATKDVPWQTIYDNPFEFNVHGYYIKVDKASYITEPLNDAKVIYANIIIESESEELIGFDDDNYHQEDSTYSGVKFTAGAPDPNATYSLVLFERKTLTEDWAVSEQSKEKFDGTSFQVDGGVIA